MKLKEELGSEVDSIFREKWNTRDELTNMVDCTAHVI